MAVILRGRQMKAYSVVFVALLIFGGLVLLGKKMTQHAPTPVPHKIAAIPSPVAAAPAAAPQPTPQPVAILEPATVAKPATVRKARKARRRVYRFARARAIPFVFVWQPETHRS